MRGPRSPRHCWQPRWSARRSTAWIAAVTTRSNPTRCRNGGGNGFCGGPRAQAWRTHYEGLFRRHSGRPGDPLLEVVEGAAAEHLFLRQGFGGPAQAFAAFVSRQRIIERRKQAKIDVHRLVGAKAGRVRIDMAAGDMRQQCAAATYHGAWRQNLAGPLSGG